MSLGDFVSSTRRTIGAVALLVPFMLPSVPSADEVDDILALKTRNRDRVVRFSADYSVHVTSSRATSVKSPNQPMKYLLTRERASAGNRSGKESVWRTEISITAPTQSRMRVEGTRVWTMDSRGQWIEQKLPPEIARKLSEMGEQFLGSDPAEQRKHFEIKILRKNGRLWGPKTTTVEFRPKGIEKLFERMQEDVAENGLPLATRLYDRTGREIANITVGRHRVVAGIPVVEVMDTVISSEAGEIVTRTECSNIVCETEP
jgi:hypothetical protein